MSQQQQQDDNDYEANCQTSEDEQESDDETVVLPKTATTTTKSKKSKPTRTETRCGLLWPVQRTRNSIRKNTQRSLTGISPAVAVGHAAVLEYLTHEVLDNAITLLTKTQKEASRITVKHVLCSLDEEIRNLAGMHSNTLFVEAPRIPHYQQTSLIDDRLRLVQKRVAKKSANSSTSEAVAAAS